MKKVFLDNLPRLKSKGANKGKIDWKNSVGFKVKFRYQDIDGEIEIIEWHKDDIIIIKYKNRTFKTTTCTLNKGSIGRIVGKKTRDFKIEIGTHFKDDKRDLIITDREYRNRVDNKGNNKYYRYTCNNCGWSDGWTVESNLVKGKGCACCSPSPKVVISGLNSAWDTDRWLVDLGVSKEDAKKLTKSSGKKIVVKCPDCGREKITSINHIYTYKTISCICNTNYSYPEKFMYSILKQLSVDFKTQYSPSYIKPKRSDFYLPNYRLVVEMDGRLGHRGGIVHSKSKQTLKELVELDDWKDEQHLKHGKRVIRINCFKSDMCYIKNSILNSELFNIFDFSKVDWLKCEEFALKNIVKEVCNYWNKKEDWETTKDLADVFEFDSTTIRNYLKKGMKLGWCIYDGKKEADKNNNRADGRNKKRCSKAVEVFKDRKSFGIFESTAELERQSEKIFGIRLDHSKIGMVANGQRNHHKGYTFKYVE